MGIAEDFDGLKSKWSTYSILTKVFLCSSLILSVLSITSIADHVFKLKGFILEGVKFWSIFTSYFVDWLSFLHITVYPWQIDFWVIIGLVMIPYISVRWSVLSTRLKLRYFLMIWLYILVPYNTKPEYAIGAVIVSYFGVLVLCFLPPRTSDFLTIAARAILPPFLVFIVAAISEGIFRVAT